VNYFGDTSSSEEEDNNPAVLGKDKINTAIKRNLAKNYKEKHKAEIMLDKTSD
jgi:hypothetical protein